MPAYIRITPPNPVFPDDCSSVLLQIEEDSIQLDYKAVNGPAMAKRQDAMWADLFQGKPDPTEDLFVMAQSLLSAATNNLDQADSEPRTKMALVDLAFLFLRKLNGPTGRQVDAAMTCPTNVFVVRVSRGDDGLLDIGIEILGRQDAITGYRFPEPQGTA